MTVLDLLDALVRIDSVNPGLDPAGAGETEIAAFVADWARDAGLRVQVVERTSGRPSVILRGGRDRGGRRLLLCGHLVTVGLAGTRDPLTPRIEGDRLYAHGAYDMKAGLAAALIACREASRSSIDREVLVTAVADEELASLGAQDVLTELDPASIAAAVVTEPTERQVGTAHRGFVWTEVTVTGVAAHGSRPHLGADAILAAGHHLVAFDHLDQQLGDRPHPFLGPGNLHASLITGGTEESTIPDRCTFIVERRTLPEDTLERVEADIADLLERCRPTDPRLTVSARTVLHRPPDGDPARGPHRRSAPGRSRTRHDRGADVLLGRLRLYSPPPASPPCCTDPKEKEHTPTSNGSAAPEPIPPQPSSPNSPETFAPETSTHRQTG